MWRTAFSRSVASDPLSRGLKLECRSGCPESASEFAGSAGPIERARGIREKRLHQRHALRGDGIATAQTALKSREYRASVEQLTRVWPHRCGEAGRRVLRSANRSS